MTGSIGRYELQAELGRGGFGLVYRAWDPMMRRAVAIKILAAAADTELLARFDAEAGTTGRLRHNNIVTVYDYGRHDGAPYLVMELLEGKNLKELIEAGRLGVLDRIRILVEVAQGLEYAHTLGVIHRDVKPANVVVLDDGGTAKVMDFGIARLVSQAATRLTMRGLLVGTMPYMAPEQFQGQDADPQTDIFSYGILCYELLSGQHPFRAEIVSQMMFMINNAEPAPLRQCNAEVPEALEAAIARMLAKPRELRYHSLEDVLMDIGPVLVELRQDKARALIEEARPLVESGSHDAAQAALRQALELDPANRQAQELRRRVQQEIRRTSVRQQVESLVADGNQRLGRREYPEAVRAFESAWKLDTFDSGLKALFEQAREAHRKAERAGQLFEEAQRAAAAGGLEEARARAVEAAQLDPDRSALAEPFLRDIEARLERQARERRLSAGLRGVEEQRARGEWAGALATLAALERELGSVPVLTALQEALTAGMRRQQRAAQARAGLAEVDQMRREGRLMEALERAGRLAAEFPEEDAVAQAAADLGQELARGISEVSREVEAALARRQFGEARRALEAGLARYPGDETLGRLNVLAARAVQEHAETLDRVRQEARAAWEAGRVDESVRALEAAAALHLTDPDLHALLEAARREQGRRELEAMVERALERARRHEQEGRAEAALNAIEETLPVAPRNAALLAEAERLRAKIAAERRRAELRSLSDAVWGALNTDNVEQARKQLGASRKTLGEEQLWRTLEVEVERRAAFLERWAEAERRWRLGDAAAAEILLVELAPVDPDGRTARLLDELRRERAYREQQEAERRRVEQEAAVRQQRESAEAAERARREQQEAAARKQREFAEALERARPQAEVTASRALPVREAAVAAPQVAAPQVAAPRVAAPRHHLVWLLTAAGAVIVAGAGSLAFLLWHEKKKQPEPPAVSLEASRPAPPVAVGQPGAVVAESRVAARAVQTEGAPSRLKPALATLAFAGAIPGTQVIVDGAEAGRAGADGRFSWKGTPGAHTLRLALDGYAPREQPIELEAGHTATLSQGQVALTRIPRPAQPPPGEPRADTADTAAQARRASGGAPVAEASQLATQLNFDKVNQNDLAALRDFASRNPSFEPAKQALAAANAIQQAHASADADRKAILHTLAAFGSAFDRRDMETLKSLWPGMPAALRKSYSDTFHSLKTTQLSITPLGGIAISGNTAQVPCRITYTAESSQRKPSETSSRSPVTLRRNGAGWVIESLE